MERLIDENRKLKAIINDLKIKYGYCYSCQRFVTSVDELTFITTIDGEDRLICCSNKECANGYMKEVEKAYEIHKRDMHVQDYAGKLRVVISEPSENA